MSIWNFLGLPSKADYDALLEAVEGLAEKEEVAVRQLSTLVQAHMDQQADCQQRLLQELSGLQEQLTRTERALAEYSAFARKQLGSIWEQLQERQEQLNLHATDARASSEHLEHQIDDLSAVMQAQIDASSERCIESIESTAASILGNTSVLSEKMGEYYAALARGLRAFSKQQISAQSDGISSLETQIAQLFDLLKCIWLSDLSSSLEGMLPNNK